MVNRLTIAMVACACACACVSIAACAQDGLDAAQTSAALDEAYFRCEVQPVLAARCAFFACHGSATRPFRVYARNRLRFDVASEEREAPMRPVELTYNFEAARAFAGDERRPALLLLKPLEEDAGGYIHVGATLYGRGDVFRTADDPGYRKLAAWISGATAETDCVETEEVGP
jgi:hypothetical protein